ncbi:MAG: branched-chain amino acid aminotransferase [Microthrixaceae bacterium]|nr:branched-chain amino acid aminotransferase [Microthrixaceae bacterium]
MHPLIHVGQSSPRPAVEREAILQAPVFGEAFTDHMVLMRWTTSDDGVGEWGPIELHPFGPLSLSPATLALHYGQSIFEAFKAYAQADGTVAVFRIDRNAARMDQSARRLAMPTLPEGAFVQSCEALIDADRAWVPTQPGSALYVRPFLFGVEAHLSVRPATEYLYAVIASPVASYFGPVLGAITVAVESNDVRAVPGGTGAVKFAGNYAAGFAAHGRAGDAGGDQVLWLDAAEHRWVEELNAMNVMFLWERGGRLQLSTPPLRGTILEGITRDSLLELARESNGVPGDDGLGIDEVVERPTSIEEVREGLADGTLREMFACGTAAVIVPIGRLIDGETTLTVGSGGPGEVTMALRSQLLGIQYGDVADTRGWMHPIDPGA